MTRPNATALNGASSATAAGLALALAADGGAPEWVQLMPAGPAIQGRDGRAWTMPDAAALAARSRTPFAFDWEHGQDLRAPAGEAAPAAGWVEALDVRDGQVWGRVEWTERARSAISAREYRFVSPAFLFSPDGQVVELIGAALVNRPNFDMAALNSRTETPMLKALLAALGLPETATEADAVAALNRQRDELKTALNASATPPLEKFVPRADYDAALNRATAAEAALADQAKAAHEARVQAAIDGALKAGKIAPASKDFYLATCRTAEGFVAFEGFLAAAPSVFGVSDVETRSGAAATALNAEQKAAAKAMGIGEAEFVKFVAAQAA